MRALWKRPLVPLTGAFLVATVAVVSFFLVAFGVGPDVLRWFPCFGFSRYGFGVGFGRFVEKVPS